MTTETIIEIRNLWYSYDEYPVLKEVDMDVQQGEFLAIIGPNGGGKTTLLKLILGILKPDRGYVRVFGKEPRESAGRIGYVPQDTSLNRDFPITVFDVVLMGKLGGRRRRRADSKRDREVVEESLTRVDMWKYRKSRIGELSGGQRQRVFIARALTSEPEILFLDEPTASVDVEGQSTLYHFFNELNKTVTIVVVSHDVSVLSSYVKSVACVNQRVYFHDESEITPDMLQQAYHCPVELIAHGVPHRVLRLHEDD